MNTISFTIAGMNFRYGTEFAKEGMTVELVKDPANEYDHEAIKVNMPGLGQIGWVANSVGTVLGDCYSAGRIFDKIDDTAADAAIVLALISSIKDIPVPDDMIAMGEIGLAGEFRSVTSAPQRIAEAARLGFSKIAVPKRQLDGKRGKIDAGGCELIGMNGIYDALSLLAKAKKKTEGEK